MPELRIYDSQGESYDPDSADVNSRIESFFFGGVRVYLDIDTTSELVVFFRARESKSGRAEQYYAVYRTQELRQLFDRFKTALRQRVEDEYGMTLQTTSDDVELFRKLEAGRKPVPGSSTDHDRIASLLRDGHKLRFGVPTADAALGLFRKFSQGDASTIAIGENTSIDALEDCDLTIEVGDYDGLVPLGETESLFEVSSESTGPHDSDTDRPLATENDSTSSSRWKRFAKLGVLSGLGVIALVVLAIVGINVAALQGVTHSAADPVVFVGGEGADEPTQAAPTLENVTIEGESVYPIADSNDDERLEVTVDENELLWVSGETNQDAFAFELTQDSAVSDSYGGKTGGEFRHPLENASNGEGELWIAVGEDSDGDDWVATETTVPVVIDGVDSDENDSGNGDEPDQNGSE